uniref:Uncharacterized protein n=1 Tax=Candidatus Kentrum sp. LFY TaxID=2126342 RepID=A0A450VBW1_9GAMM|nr:MAG: hypothetical protein BECKLFY1418A_GA0070994_11853 [Candidatus Kentron sp. LFY]
MAEYLKGCEQDGLSVGRESYRPQGRTRSLKCWYSFEMANKRTSRVLIITEDNTGASVKGEDVKVRRSQQAVACRK